MTTPEVVSAARDPGSTGARGGPDPRHRRLCRNQEHWREGYADHHDPGTARDHGHVPPVRHRGEDFFADGGGCQGTSGYDDVEPGLQVTVSDQSGTVIGNGALDTGEAQEGGCVFRFEVNNIPVASFYKVAVGRRGEISYSLDQMKQASWSVELSLGD